MRFQAYQRCQMMLVFMRNFEACLDFAEKNLDPDERPKFNDCLERVSNIPLGTTSSHSLFYNFYQLLNSAIFWSNLPHSSDDGRSCSRSSLTFACATQPRSKPTWKNNEDSFSRAWMHVDMHGLCLTTCPGLSSLSNKNPLHIDSSSLLNISVPCLNSIQYSKLLLPSTNLDRFNLSILSSICAKFTI